MACARNQLSGPHLEFLAQYGAGAPTPPARLAGGEEIVARGQQRRDRTVGMTEPLPGPANGSVVPTQGWPSLGVGSW